jgi:hypothetical protein
MVAAMLALPAAGVAHASGNGNVTGNYNIPVVSGNTVNAPISVPVNICGVSLAVLGFANSGCQGGASSAVSGVGGNNDNGNVEGNGNIPVVSGNTVTAPISAPVNVCGVSGAVGGFANSDCKGGASSSISGAGGNNHNGNITGNHNIPVLSGNTVTAPVSAPVNLCGISLGLLGFSNASCVGGATSSISGTGGHDHNGNVTGNFNIPVLSGNTVTAPVSAPVNVCGVSGAVGGFANSDCQGGSTSCIGSDCNQCHGSDCHQCHGNDCNQCHGSQCHQCHGNDCNQCHGSQCHQCHGSDCNQCHGSQCHQCHGSQCNQCHGSQCTPPGGCQGSGCTPPHHGTRPGGTTSVTSATTPSNNLPTTGADLLLLGVAAIGAIGVGAGTVVVARRRRNGEAA